MGMGNRLCRMRVRVRATLIMPVEAEPKRARDDRFLRIRTLRKSGDSSGLLVELAAARAVNNDDAVCSAVMALGRLHERNAAAPVSDLLRHPRPAVRRRAARVLGMLGTSEVAADLIAALSDPDPATVGWTADSLAKLQHQPAIPALIEALQSPSQKVRRAGAYALGEMNAEEARGALQAASKTSSRLTRLTIWRSLRKLAHN